MVPDPNSSTDGDPTVETTGGDSSGREPAVNAPTGRESTVDDAIDPTYEIVYRATRDAIWDVVGTATLIVFFLVLASLAFSAAYGGLSPLLTGSSSSPSIVVGVVGLLVGLFAASRVYALVTE